MPEVVCNTIQTPVENTVQENTDEKTVVGLVTSKVCNTVNDRECTKVPEQKYQVFSF